MQYARPETKIETKVKFFLQQTKGPNRIGVSL
jgi:hypothetical protein